MTSAPARLPNRALAACLAVLLLPGALAAQTTSASIARAVSVQGTVEARRAGQTVWQAVKLHDTYAAGDTIRVGERSRADLQLLDQSVLRLNAGTELTLEPVKEQRTGVVNLLRGAAHFFSRGPRSLEVQTPFTIAGVRGTEFFIALEPDRTLLTIFEGTVLAENQAGSLTLTSGQSAVAERGRAPGLRVVARPRDAVHWALYYPPVLHFRPDEFPAGPDWRGMVRQSLEHARGGDFQRAFDAIATVPATVTDPRFFAYRAHLLLAVGRVDEAQADIARALQLAPDNADALALQTIIAVVQGDKDRAMDAAQRAGRAAPSSATAHIALSYAQQARFDLEGARASVQRAVDLDAQNALAWARLSELWASFGELDRALQAAQRAAALEPTLSRTQTVLGYAYLMRVQTRQAKEAFERAIALDSADPLPRLGLGLARIREGDLNAGSREIEAAASLDPSNAIVRSYLGKAYYEEKRTGLDEREYAVARQLDPNDPTPRFYDAIARQTTNRPVEALQAMQEAIALNDNRAVYRSRLLLDEDLAARSAAQARIYSDLGFQPLALVEGWKSVNTDPTNFSAHRFLADSYAILPRHEIARVSELLQSQLLQPLNMTPIQPRLAESNLFLLSASGPGSLSFNEFNPLFNRDGVTLQATALAGENDTWAGEAILGGIYRRLSFSLGYSHFDTDGWRVNADQKDRIANAFLQLELSPTTSVQAEYRYREIERGDLELRFFQDDVLPNFRSTVETDTYRLGLRHAFSPGSIVLVSLIHQIRDDVAHDEDPTFTLDVKSRDQRATNGEIQYLLRTPRVNLVAGAGHVDIDRDQTLDLTLVLFPGFELDFVETVDLDTRHTNVYLYSYLNALRTVTVTLGASGDFFDVDTELASEPRKQFNPKVGVVWTVTPATTVRAAVFRVLKRTLVSNQTLEPTQVAGFNQFFDDLDSTDAWRYGAALDQKFSRSVYGGVEYSQRDLDVPIPFTDPVTAVTELRREDWKERLGRAYLFWTPHHWVALTGEYHYERLDRIEDFGFGVKEVTTHKVPLGVRVFHPSGLSLALKTTYYNQHGQFQRRNFLCCDGGKSDFILTDVAVSYRLPKRYGFITLGAANVFDQQFRYHETDFANPTIQPDRMIFGRITLALP